MRVFSFLKRFSYRHIATVHGLTRNTWRGQPAGTDVGSWMLYENGFGWRKFRTVGHAGDSEFAQGRRNAVMIWRKGGPLPECVSAAPDKPKAKLIVLKGGAQ